MRVLAGLWPLFHGTIIKPDAMIDDIMYITQKPYFSHGSLLDQIIYPHTREEYSESGYCEHDLNDILRIVQLSYIPKREGGFESTKEWKDVFSGKDTICFFVLIVMKVVKSKECKLPEYFIIHQSLLFWMKQPQQCLMTLKLLCIKRPRSMT